MPQTILIVEDHEETRVALAKLLDLEGYKVITAEDGQQGLGQAQAESPDLILSDIMMPNMDGIEMIKRLREQPRLKTTPILIASAYIDETGWALRAGADSAIPKPIDVHLMLRTIERLLEDSDRSA